MTPYETPPRETDDERAEGEEWMESLAGVLARRDRARAQRLLCRLHLQAAAGGVVLPCAGNTPYLNTIPLSLQPPYPGEQDIEMRIRHLIRWNAMAMVVRANRSSHGIGGHIATYASAATLLEVGFNHFFKCAPEAHDDDLVYFQGHAAPGVYARAFLEGRISEAQLLNFRRELAPGGGLSSYPHPWLMPDFWEFPTVSMGLGPLMAIYQARFNRYLEDRGLKKATGKVWAFLGDGEMDEPESLGALSLAGRERLDNLIFVVNCNLQRLDGPVRGNGKIIQELESFFRGAGWNVLKVIWGKRWDPLLARDADGALAARMEAVVDGEYQKYTVEGGAYIRRHFFGADPRLLSLVSHLSDQDLAALPRGGHDPSKIYAAYWAATRHTGSPTVVLAKTVKGYGMGETGEGRNVTHQRHELDAEGLRAFARRFDIPVSDDEIERAAFCRPPDGAPEMRYLHERRRALGGYVPRRNSVFVPAPAPAPDAFEEFRAGSEGREVSTTMAFVRLLSKLMRDKDLGPRVVPIVPDEARTFGMDALFRQAGIYSHVGQTYEPVDRETLLYYREAIDGQILEEGITEAGSMASFIAAGASGATRGVATVPFFIFYSMFGFQRVGDLVWAASDMRCRGFMIGATSGRTTLPGEGLQHQDGNSHLLALPVPALKAYDPAYAYEIAVIVKDGLKRMFADGEPGFYYLTVANEQYAQPPMPEGSEEGIVRGMYRVDAAKRSGPEVVRLLGSGAILNEARKAARILEDELRLPAEAWSVTSWKALYEDARAAERGNLLHPARPVREPFVRANLAGAPGVVVAATDYVKALPLSVARWAGHPFVALGTDGFGRSESREALRDFFEVDARHIAAAAIGAMSRAGFMPAAEAAKALAKLGVDPSRPDPASR